MKNLLSAILLVFVGFDLCGENYYKYQAYKSASQDEKAPREWWQRQQEWFEDGIVGVGGGFCFFCCFPLLLPIPAPGLLVHTPYRIGVEGTMNAVMVGLAEYGGYSSILWNAQLIYDIVQKPIGIIWLEKGHLYVGVGGGGVNFFWKDVPEANKQDTAWINTLYEEEKIGIAASVGIDVIVRLNIFKCCRAPPGSRLIVGGKLLWLYPWKDETVREYRKGTDKKVTVEKKGRFSDILFYPAPYVYFGFGF